VCVDDHLGLRVSGQGIVGVWRRCSDAQAYGGRLLFQAGRAGSRWFCCLRGGFDVSDGVDGKNEFAGLCDQMCSIGDLCAGREIDAGVEPGGEVGGEHERGLGRGVGGGQLDADMQVVEFVAQEIGVDFGDWSQRVCYAGEECGERHR